MKTSKNIVLTVFGIIFLLAITSVVSNKAGKNSSAESNLLPGNPVSSNPQEITDQSVTKEELHAGWYWVIKTKRS